MSKEAFRKLCEKDPSIPIFLRYEWISSVAEAENWNVVFSGDPQDPKGFLVYFIKKKWGFKKITLPPLTPYLGPWLFYPADQKRSQRYGYEKKVMEELIDELPTYDDLLLHFHPHISNWLPFYWRGFGQNLRYTYQLDTSGGTEALFQDLKGNIRRQIRKAQKSLELHSSDSIETLHDLKIADYQEKSAKLNYDRAYFRNLDRSLASQEKRKILYAIDSEGVTYGGIYLVFSHRTCYYLVGAADPKTKNEGTMSLLMWKGIEEAAERGLLFDFEGSMIEPIERFFRSFGAEQVPYHQVRKTPSLLLRGKQTKDLLTGKG